MTERWDPEKIDGGRGKLAMNDVDEYLTAGEVARILHVSPKTVSRWATRNLIPCVVTLGGHRRFHRDDVEEVRRRMEEGYG